MDYAGLSMVGRSAQSQNFLHRYFQIGVPTFVCSFILKKLGLTRTKLVPDLAGYVFSLTCTTWPVRPHIALCASLLLVHEPPKIAAVFVHGLTRNWSPELARSLIAYLDGVLEWDERQFKDFSATYNSCVAQVHEFEQREKECVGINDELEENCDANRISSASGASSNATARKDGVSSVETAWAGHKYALREVTVELANSMVDMNMDTGMRLDEVASLYRSQLTLKDYKFFISDFRIAVAEYQLAVFRHYIECDRCRVGFRCEKVQDMGLSSLNNAAVAAAAAATFYHAFTRDSPGSSFCESSRDLFDRQGSTLSPTDGCTLDSSRSGSGWTRESSFEPWSTATSGISDTEGTRMWVASRSVPSQNTAHQGSDIDVDSRVSTASRRSPTRRESLLSIATNHQNSFVFCDIEHTARLIRERTLAMAEAVLQCSERDRTPNDESGSIRIQSADDGSIEGSNATTQGNPRIRLSPTEASLIGELDPIIGHFLSCDVTDCQECLTAFSLEHPNQLFKLSSASSTTSLTAVPTERVSSELRSSDLSQADSRRVSTASRDGNRGSNTLLEGDTIDRLVQYAARTLSSAGSVFDPSSSARRNINDVQTDSTQHPASVARINTALSRMDLAELIDRAARMPSTLSLFDQ
ncbi:hypothetical protein BJ742DRAFT_53899 [Cladochytrium replicatum]|nr:hypothetical protein BJ742DRAFT_53899 [Cladochytrium replicatum]